MPSPDRSPIRLKMNSQSQTQPQEPLIDSPLDPLLHSSSSRSPSLSSSHSPSLSYSPAPILTDGLPHHLPMIISILGTGATIFIIHLLTTPSDKIYQLILLSSPIQWCTLSLFFWGIGQCILKLIKIRREETDFNSVHLMLQTYINRLSANEPHTNHQQLNELLYHVKVYERSLSCSFLSEMIAALKSAESNDHQLHTVIEREKERCYDQIEVDYKGITAVMWLMPLAGFLGTVVGMSSAIGSFDGLISNSGASLSSLAPAVSGLATAFDTTLLALSLVIPLKLLEVALEKRDIAMIHKIEDSLGIHLIRHDSAQNNVQDQHQQVLMMLNEQTLQAHQNLHLLTQTFHRLNTEIGTLPPIADHLTAQLEASHQLLSLHQNSIPQLVQAIYQGNQILLQSSEHLKMIKEQNDQPLVLSRGKDHLS